MNDLITTLYNYLYSAGKPVGLGEICNDQKFRDYSRQEVAKALFDLQGKEQVFRSLKNGKAYYSTKSSEGEALNGSRKNLNSISNAGGLAALFAALNGYTNNEENNSEKQEKFDNIDTHSAKADLSQRVVVDNSFVVRIPSDMIWSTDVNEINQNRVLSAITTEKTEEYNDFSLSNPFSARRNISITHPLVRELDMTNKLMVNLISKTAEATLGSDALTVRDDDVMVVKYNVSDRNTANILIVNEHGIYMTQYFINDVTDQNEKIALAKAFAETIEECPEEDKQLSEAEVFRPFTYNENKTAVAGVFSMPVPDEMETMDEYNERRPEDVLYRRTLDKDFYYLAIPKGYSQGFTNHVEAPKAILLRKVTHKDPKLGLLWVNNDQISVDIDDTLIRVLRTQVQQMSGESFEPKSVYVDRTTKTAVAFSQIRAVPEKYWNSYMYVIFHDDTLFQGQIFLRAKGSREQMEQAVYQFLSKVKLLPDDELEKAEKKMMTAALNNYAAKDGQIDAVKVAQLFTNDVVFNNENEIVADGRHNRMKLFQFNAEVINDYPDITSNYEVFNKEILRTVNFVEENENLIIPKERMHKELLAATFGKGLSGSMIFNLCAHHMIHIAEKGRQYTVALDDNLIKGIPQAYKYIAEFIQTLREANGKNGDFDVAVASMFNVMSPIENAIEQPVEGAAKQESSVTLKVHEKEHPFAGVVRSVERQIAEKARKAEEEKKRIAEEKKRREEENRKKAQYSTALKYASSDKMSVLKVAIEEFEKLGDYSDSVQQREKAGKRLQELIIKEEEENESKYNEAVSLIQEQPESADALQRAVSILQPIRDYKDSVYLIAQTNNKLYEIRTYDEALELAGKDTINDVTKAVARLEQIRSYKDADHKIELLKQRLVYLEEKEKKEELERRLAAEKKAKEEELERQLAAEKEAKAKKKKKRKRRIILFIVLLILIAAGAAGYLYYYLFNAYERGVGYFNNGEYDLAAEEFASAGAYSDAEELMNLSKYRYVKEHYDDVRTQKMYEYFEDLQAIGYPVDEIIVDKLTTYKVRLVFNNSSKVSSNAIRVNVNQPVFIHINCLAGYRDQEIPVRLVLYYLDEEVAVYDGLAIKEGSEDYIELDQETKDRIGTGIVKAILYDENGNKLFAETSLFADH